MVAGCVSAHDVQSWTTGWQPLHLMDRQHAAYLLQDGTQKSQKVFVNIPTEVGASEPEEIGAQLAIVVGNRWLRDCQQQQQLGQLS